MENPVLFSLGSPCDANIRVHLQNESSRHQALNGRGAKAAWFIALSKEKCVYLLHPQHFLHIGTCPLLHHSIKLHEICDRSLFHLCRQLYKQVNQ